MKNSALLFLVLLTGILPASAQSADSGSPTRVKVQNGWLEGYTDPNGIREFKGVPYAQPPVGDLRWKAPQPAKDWTGVRPAMHFGPRAMQKNIYSDMKFRSSGTSEDCLYLNVWTPSRTGKEKLPVLVYFYGGGFVAGDGSEYRYDGESMATKGIVAVTVNYRLGIFGFFSHPELTQESPYHGSGNYGLLDQNAALVWVKNNIAVFGGDPSRVTIAGESAGSISVCGQVASPLSKGLFSGAIGESGGLFNPVFSPLPQAQADQMGLDFAKKIGRGSLASLRAMTAEQLLDSASGRDGFRVTVVQDGYFLPRSTNEIFGAGDEMHVPLLAGWNSAEVPYMAFLRGQAPTPDNYSHAVHSIFPNQADEVLKLFPGEDQQEVIRSATALASDMFIAYSTWKWVDMQAKTGGQPVFAYIYSRPRPSMAAAASTPSSAQGNQMPPALAGASHSSEIEYALGNLSTNKTYAWTADDYKVSSQMEDYFANFIKTHNPNGPGLSPWTPLTPDKDPQVMNIDVKSQMESLPNPEGFQFFDQFYKK